MIQPAFEILNQRGTPMFFSDVFANRPTAGIIGRIFISTDTKEFYRDTGSTWELIGGPGSGTVTGSGAAGQVTFWNGASTITGDANFLFDSTQGFFELYSQGNDTIQIGRKSAIAQYSQQNGLLFGSFVSGVFRDTSEIRSYYTGNGTQRSGKLVFITRNTAGTVRAINFGEDGEIYTFGSNIPNTYPSKLFVAGRANTASTYTAQFHNSSGSNFSMAIDDAGKVLIGTGTATGTGNLQVTSSTGDSHIRIWGSNSPSLRIDNAVTSATQRFALGISTATNNFIQGSTSGDVCITTASANPLLFGMWQTINASEVMRISTANNLLVGTNVDNGQKFQVQGDAFIKGSGNTSATTALTVQNSDGTNLLRVRNDNNILYGTRPITIFTSQNGSTTDINGRALVFSFDISAFDTPAFTINTGTLTTASGLLSGNLRLVSTFAPTSGTAQLNGINVIPTINQTGGANGITRGLYINPTLTAAADWRSIEWSNNSGWGIYGAGTSPNYLNGNLNIASTSNPGQKLYVNGSVRIDGQTSATAGGSAGLHLILNLDGTNYKIALLNV